MTCTPTRQVSNNKETKLGLNNLPEVVNALQVPLRNSELFCAKCKLNHAHVLTIRDDFSMHLNKSRSI